MEYTQKQVENAVMFFAKKYDQEENYKYLIEVYGGISRIVEMIIYEMFVNKFDFNFCTTEEFEQYRIIHKFATELKTKGYVEYSK